MMRTDGPLTLRALETLSELGLGRFHIASSVSGLDVIVPDDCIGDRCESIAETIRTVCGTEVTLTSEIGIVCVVGQDLGKSFMQITVILNTLAARGIEPLFYELGGSRTNLVIGVAQVRLQEAVRTIYDYVFRNNL